MGVPKFFRWLTKAYPTIVSSRSFIDQSVDNPPEVPECMQFDCIYLDMNGILHNCSFNLTSLEEREAQMKQNFFNKLETIFSVAFPRKLVFLALDGVAPRAKMNQQRTRRFMARLTHNPEKKAAAKPQVYINQPYYDSKDESSSTMAAMLPEEILIREKVNPADEFDSNCITPGTEFMENAASWLEEYALMKIKDKAWSEEVIFIVSNSSVPGEGEHKIIDFIRCQRHHSNYNPNDSHLIYGGDADLIFLGLALHEENVFILREGTLQKSKAGSYSSSKYSGPPPTSNKPGRISKDTIFVSELHLMTTEMELGQLFEPCGPILSVKIISDGHGKAHNFGFVRFGTITANTGNDNEFDLLPQDKQKEVESAMVRAVQMNGHKLRGKAIHVEYARSGVGKPVVLSENEQMKTIEQRELRVVEFMSVVGLSDTMIANSCLNFTKWNVEEAVVFFLEFVSSGLDLDIFIANKTITDLEMKQSAPASSSIQSNTPISTPSTPAPNPETGTSPSDEKPSSSDPANNGDGDEDDDGLPIAIAGSPYVLVNLKTLKMCFNDKYSRISCVQEGVDQSKVTTTKPKQERYQPSAQRQPLQNEPQTTNNLIESNQVENGSSSNDDPSADNVEGPTMLESIFKSFEVDRVIDDFVLLGMIFGNDFLPGMPSQDIQQGSFKTLLLEYMDHLVQHGYICQGQDFDYISFAHLLDAVSLREERAIRKKVASAKRQARSKKSNSLLDSSSPSSSCAASPSPPIQSGPSALSTNTVTTATSASTSTISTSSSPSSHSNPNQQSNKPSRKNDKNDNIEEKMIQLAIEESLKSANISPANPDIVSIVPEEGERAISKVVSMMAGIELKEAEITPTRGKRSRNKSAGPNSSPTSGSPVPKDSRHTSNEENTYPSSPLASTTADSVPKVKIDYLADITLEEVIEKKASYYVHNFTEISFEGLTTDVEKCQHARKIVCKNYLEGLAWVMRYYFTGCASWEWYYPHHYAPFACDVAQTLREWAAEAALNSPPVQPNSSSIPMTLGSPLCPLEQLVAVLPPQSVTFIPPSLRHLVLEPTSPLAPYFPLDPKVQKSDGISPSVAKWKGVLRLPFIPRPLLINTVQEYSKEMTMFEHRRNQFAPNIAIMSARHSLAQVCQLTATNTFDDKDGGKNVTISQELEIAQLMDAVFPIPMCKVSIAKPETSGAIFFYFDVRRPTKLSSSSS